MQDIQDRSNLLKTLGEVHAPSMAPRKLALVAADEGSSDLGTAAVEKRCMNEEEPSTPPAKMKFGKIPTAVQHARLALQGRGITPASLREMLSSKEFNNLSNNFRVGLSPTLKSEYKALATDDQRREWLAQYVIDPLAAITKGFNKTTAYSSQESTSRLV